MEWIQLPQGEVDSRVNWQRRLRPGHGGMQRIKRILLGEKWSHDEKFSKSGQHYLMLQKGQVRGAQKRAYWT